MTKTRSNRVGMVCIYSFIFKCGSLYGEKVQSVYRFGSCSPAPAQRAEQCTFAGMITWMQQ